MKHMQLSRHIHTKLQKFIKDIVNEVEQISRLKGKSVILNSFYPAVAVGCEYKHFKACGRSKKSKLKPLIRVITLHKALKLALYNATGYYPETVKEGPPIVFVGTCAEDHAANEIINKVFLNKGNMPKLEDLKFTNPRRPRTYEVRKKCSTCRKIFK